MFVGCPNIKMELFIIILTFKLFLSTDAQLEHEAYHFAVCSDTEQEIFLGYDGEELWHINFDQKKEELTVPTFVDPLSFSEFMDLGFLNLEECKTDLVDWVGCLNFPPPAMDPPQTSIYPKDDVFLDVDNILVCYVTGFYPPSLSISWTKNNLNVTEGVRLSQYRPKADGTFNIFSTLKFTPAEGDVYSCTVNHRALQGQLQTKIWDVDVPPPSVGPAAFCGVGLTLGLLGIAGGTLLFLKAKDCN